MKKKIIVFLLALSAVAMSACSLLDSAPTTDATPSRMVTKLDIATNPADEDDARSYTEQETISFILRALQDLKTDDYPLEPPALNEEKNYYTITVTYANGDISAYYLLEKQYLNFGGETWCIVDNTKAVELLRYITDTPSN